MKRVINANDFKKLNNMEKCELIVEIIKRTSNIHSRGRRTIKECEK